MPELNEAPREVAKSVSQSGASNAANSTANTARKMHPMMIVAAGAVTLFSAVGIGVMTGIIPSAQSSNSANRPAVANSNGTGSAALPSATVAGAASAGVGNVSDAASPTVGDRGLKPIDSSTLGQPMAQLDTKNEAKNEAKSDVPTSAPARAQPTSKPPQARQPVKTQTATKPAPTRPTVVAQNSAPTVAQTPPSAPQPYQNNGNEVIVPPDNAPRAAPPRQLCLSCGTVDSVTPLAQAGQGSGAGAVLGGVLGGVLGHQVGNGRGRDAATAAGAIGGAVLGNSIEKNSKTTRSFDVRVRMEDATFQTVRFEAEPGVRIGDRVRIENGRLIRD